MAFGLMGGFESLAQVRPSTDFGAVGTLIPPNYQGPPPATFNPELVGPNLLLRSGRVDFDNVTVTLPLYRGTFQGTEVWYIVTDTSDEGNAAQLGLNFSPKLALAGAGRGVQTVRQVPNSNTIEFSGIVDFNPQHQLVAGPTGFPPAMAAPGSVGDPNYSPLIRIAGSSIVWNAPIVAVGPGPYDLVNYTNVHNRVVAIDTEALTVTLEAVEGFSFGRPILYISTEASDPGASAIERNTFAPNLNDVPFIGGDDGLFSARERLFGFTNGQTGASNVQRQGLSSAILGEGPPLNVLGGIPTLALDYSPIWDVNLGEWTPEAIAQGANSRQTEEFAILRLVDLGFLTGPGGAPYGSVGFVVNCPIVMRLL